MDKNLIDELKQFLISSFDNEMYENAIYFGNLLITEQPQNEENNFLLAKTYYSYNLTSHKRIQESTKCSFQIQIRKKSLSEGSMLFSIKGIQPSRI